MVKKRLIACIVCYQGKVVQTRKFNITNIIGSPVIAVDFFNTWSVDEIVLLEISKTKNYIQQFLKIVEELSEKCFLPLSVGGKILSVNDATNLFRKGADKIVVNTGAIRNPKLISSIANKYGSQCVIVSIDVKKNNKLSSNYEVYVENGKKPSGIDLESWVEIIQAHGAGEILINSIDYDGNKQGYNIDLIKYITKISAIPVIGFGGVGKWEDFADGLDLNVDAVAAGNIFHYTEHSTKKAKEFLTSKGYNMRKSSFFKFN